MTADLLHGLKNGDEQAYKHLFYLYYANLVVYANTFLKNGGAAEDVIQEFFIAFWYEKKHNHVTSDLEGYLYRSVRNLCLNYLRDDKRRMAKFSDYVVEETEDFRFSLEEMEEREEIQKAINLLPEQCRLIFTLCCLENMKYQEVADKLGISINTVRTQMTRAFKSLRDTLSGKTFTSFLFVMMSIR